MCCAIHKLIPASHSERTFIWVCSDRLCVSLHGQNSVPGYCFWWNLSLSSAVYELLKSRKAKIGSMTSLGFVSNIYCCSLAKAGWDESHLRLATRRCPAGPALGAAPLHTVVTYRLTFMAQHALVDFLGQDQVARLRSGPDFVTVQLSLCAPGWASRGEPNRNVLSSVIGRTK